MRALRNPLVLALGGLVTRPLRWLQYHHPREFTSLVYGIVYGVMLAVWSLIMGLVILLIWGLYLIIT